MRMVRKSRHYRQFRGRNERLSSFLTFSGDEVIIHPAILPSVVHPVILIEMLRGSNEIKHTHIHTYKITYKYLSIIIEIYLWLY